MDVVLPGACSGAAIAAAVALHAARLQLQLPAAAEQRSQLQACAERLLPRLCLARWSLYGPNLTCWEATHRLSWERAPLAEGSSGCASFRAGLSDGCTLAWRLLQEAAEAAPASGAEELELEQAAAPAVGRATAAVLALRSGGGSSEVSASAEAHGQENALPAGAGAGSSKPWLQKRQRKAGSLSAAPEPELVLGKGGQGQQ